MGTGPRDARCIASCAPWVPVLWTLACGGIVERDDAPGDGGVATTFEALCADPGGEALNPCHAPDYARLLIGQWWACSDTGRLSPPSDAVGVEFTEDDEWYMLLAARDASRVRRSDYHGLWIIGYIGSNGSCEYQLMMDNGIWATMTFTDRPRKLELRIRDDGTRLSFVAFE